MSQVQLGSNASSPPADDSSVLQVNGLTVHFKRTSIVGKRGTEIVRAVNDVSFQLKKSEITSIVGESGSGKTTVARCILRLLEPDSGSIKFEGRDIAELKGKELQRYRRDVQVIYQDPFESLNPRHNVLTTVGLPIRLLTDTHNDNEIFEQVTKLLGEVGLDPDDTIHRFPHQLSGGQRQRVSIARSLACGPKLLIADEPITMLDAAQRMNILSLIHDLQVRRNLTVLMITHDLASARLISQKTFVMYVGRIVEYANTGSILNEPRHPYVELLLKASPGLNVSMPTYDEYTSGTIEDSAALTKGCVFRPRCKYAQTKCADVSPPLEEKTPGHFTACHYPLATAQSQGDST